MLDPEFVSVMEEETRRGGGERGTLDRQNAFPDRKTKIHGLIAAGDTVVTETEWWGTASEHNPMLKPGERQGLREVIIHRFRDGKIVETREYGIVVPAP